MSLGYSGDAHVASSDVVDVEGFDASDIWLSGKN